MRLMVSYDCGSSYGEKATGSLEEMKARATALRLDEQMLRWVIESDDGKEMAEVSAIHKKLLSFLERANKAR